MNNNKSYYQMLHFTFFLSNWSVIIKHITKCNSILTASLLRLRHLVHCAFCFAQHGGQILSYTDLLQCDIVVIHCRSVILLKNKHQLQKNKHQMRINFYFSFITKVYEILNTLWFCIGNSFPILNKSICNVFLLFSLLSLFSEMSFTTSNESLHCNCGVVWKQFPLQTV